MWRLVRRFGDVAVPTSLAVRQLVAALRAPPQLSVDSPLQGRLPAYRDLRQPLQLHLKQLTNDQLVFTVRSYSLSGEGSKELYSKAALQAMKRLHSLSSEQQATLCFALAKAKAASRRLFGSVERTFLKDIRKFPPEATAKLAYAFVESGSEVFYKTVAEIFKANLKAFTTESGLLLLVGLEKRKWRAEALEGAVEAWAAQAAASQDLLVQVFHVLLKLQAAPTAVQQVEQQLEPRTMSLRCAEHWLGCCVAFGRAVPQELITAIPQMISGSSVDAAALANLIRTVHRVQNGQQILDIVHIYLQQNLVLQSPSDVSRLVSALLETKDNNAQTLQVASALLSTMKFEVLDLLRMLLAVETHSQTVEPLIAQLAEAAAGKNLSPSEFVLAVSLLSRLRVTSAAVWQPVLRLATEVQLQDAEQYLQVRSLFHSLSCIDTSAVLSALANKYEA